MFAAVGAFDLRIAVFHNFLDNIGGAERVALTLTRELNADLYSTVADSEKIRKMGFNVKVKNIGWVPANAPLRRQLALWRFSQLDLGKDYDRFIIAGDWAVSGALKNKPNLWYVHSPMREIFDLREFTRENNVPFYARPAFDIWAAYNRSFVKKSVQSIGKIACNSKNSKNRVKKFLNREAVVIYPPVETEKFHYKESKGYWLSVNRLINHKRVELQMRAFQKMPQEKLVIVGCFEKARHFQEYANYIKSIKPENVEILSWVSLEQLVELYANCNGFLTTALDEDFGLTAVEAMASGKPVIAPNEGGYKETVINGITGKLISSIDEVKLCKAVKEVGKHPESFRKACLKQARQFSVKEFIKKTKDLMAE